MADEQPALLSADELSEHLAGLPAWTGDPSVLRRSVTAADFRAAIALVVAIADVAEAMDHHPDVDIRWRRLDLALSTHSAGGVTALDVDLARRIDSLVDEMVQARATGGAST